MTATPADRARYEQAGLTCIEVEVSEYIKAAGKASLTWSIPPFSPIEPDSSHTM